METLSVAVLFGGDAMFDERLLMVLFDLALVTLIGAALWLAMEVG